jgi:hypothetical protein
VSSRDCSGCGEGLALVVGLAWQWWSCPSLGYDPAGRLVRVGPGDQANAYTYTYANGDPINNFDPNGHDTAVGEKQVVRGAARGAGVACRAGIWGCVIGGAIAGIVVGGYYGYQWWRNRGGSAGGFSGAHGLPSWLFPRGCTAIICRSSGGSRGGGRGPAPGGGGSDSTSAQSGGLSAAQLAAIARARAIALARARTAAAKRRAALDARTNPRKFAPALRRPDYADPRDKISSDRSVRPRTPHIRNVVKDTVQSLWDIHANAVQMAGPVVSHISVAMAVVPEAPSTTLEQIDNVSANSAVGGDPAQTALSPGEAAVAVGATASSAGLPR